MGRRGDVMVMVTQEKDRLTPLREWNQFYLWECVSACMCVSVRPLTPLNHLFTYPVYTGAAQSCTPAMLKILAVS